jgi:Leucine-rich repeat (LRR) protein
MKSNRLEILEGSVFYPLSLRLRELRLISNRIHTIEPGTFNNFTQLERVDLGFGNKLTTLNSNAFGASLTTIRTFLADVNRINAIDPQFFDMAVNLEFLALLNNICVSQNFNISQNRTFARQQLQTCFNNFQAPDDDSFIECDYGQFVVTYTCQMSIMNPNGRDDLPIRGTHLPDLSNADVLMVNAVMNKTRNLPSIICQQFFNLQVLRLERLGMEIISPNALQNCAQLQLLSLDFNFLTQIADNTFDGTRNLQTLSLRFNRVSSLIYSWPGIQSF